MKNMMKEYLRDEYTENYLKNFCLYWIKASQGSGDEWRKNNDLDCLYFDGDLRADTLMSAWTPLKWVVDCLNRKNGFKIYKEAKYKKDPLYYIKLLVEEGDEYLPPEHELVILLNRFLELAEKRCNYFLLEDRRMNPARYRIFINGEKVYLFDEVPAMLNHIFNKDSLGRFFLDKDGKVDESFVVSWIKREHLEMGFEKGKIEQEKVVPLIPELKSEEAKWLTDEEEIKEALKYMISFLEKRLNVLYAKSGLK